MNKILQSISDSICFEKPVCLSSFPPLIEHTPLFFFLIDTIKPKSIVTCGITDTEFYLALFQALKTLDLDCGCYAVGSSASTLKKNMKDYEGHQPFISQLDPLLNRFIDITHDDILNYISAGSIDLLIIEGKGSQEDIACTIHSLLPKMSSRGLIVLHGINGNEDELSLKSYWDMASDQLPGFEITHAQGIGLLRAGGSLPDELDRLFRLNTVDAQWINMFFQTLSHQLSLDIAFKTKINELRSIKHTLNALNEETELKRDRNIQRCCPFSPPGRTIHEKEQRNMHRIASVLQRMRTLANSSLYRSRFHGMQLIRRSLQILTTDGPSALSRKIVNKIARDLSSIMNPHTAHPLASGLPHEKDLLCSSNSSSTLSHGGISKVISNRVYSSPKGSPVTFDQEAIQDVLRTITSDLEKEL